MIIQTGEGKDRTDAVCACGVQMQVQQLQIPILQMLLTATPNDGQGMKSISVNDGDKFVARSVCRRWSWDELRDLALGRTFIFVLPVVVITIKVLLQHDWDAFQRFRLFPGALVLRCGLVRVGLQLVRSRSALRDK